MSPIAALRSRPRLALTVLAALAFALALLRPTVPWPARVGSTLLVVDITQSMNVADARWQGEVVTRLNYTRALLRRVLRDLPCGHSAGLAVFTERKALVLLAPIEVCAHYAALDDALGTLDWRMAWAADSHLYYGTYSALDEIEKRWPGSALAFFTDGDQAPALFAGREPRYERHATTPPGVLFGVGGSTPQPVPKFDSNGRIAGYWSADDTAGFASTGAPTLSVVDMENMAAGGDVRNLAQRPAGVGASHLSQRNDAVLEAVGRVTGLQARTATDAATVVAALRALPGTHATTQRIELHEALVALGALAVLFSLLPASLLEAFRRSTFPPPPTVRFEPMNRVSSFPSALIASLTLAALSAYAHGPTPQKVDEQVEVAAPPAAVWALVGDFARVADWNPALESSTADKANEAGSKRTLTLARGGVLTEELDEYLPAEMSMSYRSGREIDPALLPVGSYSVRLRVLPAGSGSRIEWRARAYRADTGNEPAAGRDDATAVKALQDFIRPALAAAKKKAEAK